MTSPRPLNEIDLRRAPVYQLLHWLATGQVQPSSLADAYIDAIDRLDPRINAFVDNATELLREEARAADQRRQNGAIGRLDGIPIAVEDSFDIAGWPTRAGLPARRGVADDDSYVVGRLRASGAVLIGRTPMDEGGLGVSCANPHYGATQNPFRPGFSTGGSSGGAAAAVAAGLAAAAVGSDALGSVRTAASHCGICAIRPTHGEISVRGLVPTARRLDAVGLLARSVDDLTILLQVLAGYDADDARSRRRRVAMDPPDREPQHLRGGVLPDLAAFGVAPAVIALFERSLALLERTLADCRTVDFSDWDFGRTRRAGLFLMEAEMLGTFATDLAQAEPAVSSGFRRMLDFAAGKSAADYACADRVLDAATLKMRRLFAQIDVLVLPTTPQGAFPLQEAPPSTVADFTSFASLAGCPAVTLPMGILADGSPIGLQLVGPRGSDLRLLELASICAATLDAAPAYPAIG